LKTGNAGQTRSARFTLGAIYCRNAVEAGGAFDAFLAVSTSLTFVATWAWWTFQSLSDVVGTLRRSRFTWQTRQTFFTFVASNTDQARNTGQAWNGIVTVFAIFARATGKTWTAVLTSSAGEAWWAL